MKDNLVKIVNNLRLETQIGKGAMGEVWKAKHIHTGATVAAKFLLSSSKEDGWALESFQGEIRAAAVLTHPNAVMVLDHGIVNSESANNAARLQFKDKSPFLIMELVQGKSFKSFAAQLPWGRLKRLIQQLLSVLAHAHARGVIHRDIKPENVLIKLPDEDSSRPEAMLTDFGLAQAISEFRGDGDVVAGTPAYMAPEQLLGSWRDQGPWTDLYSLACTIWRIIAPEAPFGNGGHYADLAYAHVHQPPPALLNTIAIPDGLETWLLRMLAKRPQDRFYSAAEALHALNQLGPADIEAELNIDSDGSLWALSDTMEFTRDRTRALLEDNNEMPIPDDWRIQTNTRTKTHIMGVGLRMFDIRSLPFFERNDERDALWTVLKEIPDTGAQSIIIRGPAGIGKSRLAQWFCECAQETGVAKVFHIKNTETGSSGVVDLLNESLRCQDLNPEETKERLQKVLRQYNSLLRDIDKIVAILTQTETDGLFKESWERDDLIIRLLLRQRNDPTALAKPRMAIIWNDDAHFGEETLTLCQSVLQSVHVNLLPIIFVHTVKTETLTHENPCRVSIAKIQNHTRNQTIRLSPFDSQTQRKIINSMLDLSSGLVDELVQFSNGNCDLAKMVLSDLVSSEQLTLEDNGFSLNAQGSLRIPPPLYDTWKNKILHITKPFREPELVALQITGVMGMNIYTEEWHAALPHFKIDQFRWIEGELIAGKLIRRWPKGNGWSFVHPALTILLADQAQEFLQSKQVNLAAAKGIQAGKRPDKYERIGHHLIKGGLVTQGINALLKGLMLQLGRANQDQTYKTLKELKFLFYAHEIPETDSRWGQLWLTELSLAEARHDVDEVNRTNEQLKKALSENHWPVIASKYSLQMGRKAEKTGELNTAIECFKSGLMHSSHSPMLHIQLLLGQAQSLIQYGRLSDAKSWVQKASKTVRKDNPFDVALYQFTRATYLLQAQQFDQIETLLKKASAGFSSGQQLLWKAYCIKYFGDSCRFQNDIPKAKSYYQKSQVFLSQAQHPFNAVLLQDMAIIALYESKFNDALTLAQEALHHLSAMGWKRWIPRSQIIAMCVMAEYEDWGGFEFHYYSMVTLIDQIRIHNADLAWLAELSARITHKHGDTERAQDLLQLSVAQWQGLGLLSESARVQQVSINLR